MSFTNSTPNYGLPQYIGTDKPTYLGDMNTAYSTIDTQMKANADAASAATSTANTASATATAASTNATTALNTANSAASEAASATSAAASATSTANTASTNASAALRASAANTIENLAPAYDPTLTYSVGDLVTYIDENNSGKLYKCIIAVSTPEAFNLNKWDDVTTSEAYNTKDVLLRSAIADGVKTVRELLDELCAGITFDTTKEYTVRVELTSGVNFSYHTRDVSSTYLECYLASVVKNGCVVEELNLNTNGDSDDLKFTTFAGSTPPIYENISTTFVPTNRTYKLYKLPL